MVDHLQTLVSLQDSKPGFNSCSGYSELNSVLSRYTNALNFFNGYNDDYKKSTKVFYNDLSSIRDNIQRSINASDPTEKQRSFYNASNELMEDINSLICLVSPAYVEPVT